ncbi:WD40-repeat-containing domain protein [Mycena maculata]|uniref:WD40-repeat-containing domain protein n=1 Tax=Mycena maculata TaxID=230809 RepID=A0AAD7HFE5_9AGAR|nr:WD40-repeat-containing domain protein [Mycena maculata]
MSGPSKLPVVTVQPTFLEVIGEVRAGIVPLDTFWLSCYNASAPSIHTKVRVTLDEVNREAIHLEPSEGVEIRDVGKDNYVVSSTKLAFPDTKILTLTHQYADPTRANPQHPHRITAFDVAPDGSQFATGFLDGSVHIYGTDMKTPPVETAFGKPHKSTTTSLRFFPSSRVLLSAGADFTLCILPADPAPASSALTPARTMMGHRRSITSTAIVSRGRNILSASLDGTVRLWDVSSGEKIHILSAGGGRFSPVMSMSLGDRASATFDLGAAANPDPREVETSGKLLFCALQTKSFEAFDLGARAPVYTSTPGASPLTAIAYAPEHSLLATGSSTGVVEVFDTRALGAPLMAFTRGDAGVADISFTNDPQMLLVSTDDGLPFVAQIAAGEHTRVAAELIGADCDPVRSISVVGRDVWSAADDGVVRKYGAAY